MRSSATGDRHLGHLPADAHSPFRRLQELALARADGTYATLLARLGRLDCLITDERGLGTLTEVQRQDLLEVMEDRDGLPSTIITGQLPRGDWHTFLGDPTIAEAVLDRLVHNAYTIALNRGNAVHHPGCGRAVTVSQVVSDRVMASRGPICTADW